MRHPAGWVGSTAVAAVVLYLCAGTSPHAELRQKPAATPPAAQASRVIYLTFDADMTPGMIRLQAAGRVARWYDPAIVDFLQENRIPAAFFVTGLFAEAYPELMKRLAAEPLFEVDDHGYQHAAFEAPCYGLRVLRTDAQKTADITHAQAVLAAAIGHAPARFRYPGLCHSAHDDELVRQAGLTIDTPSVTSGDAFNRDAKAIVYDVLRSAKGGAEVVFHLGGPNAPATLQALRELVPMLLARGYVFRAL